MKKPINERTPLTIDNIEFSLGESIIDSLNPLTISLIYDTDFEYWKKKPHSVERTNKLREFDVKVDDEGNIDHPIEVKRVDGEQKRENLEDGNKKTADDSVLDRGETFRYKHWLVLVCLCNSIIYGYYVSSKFNDSFNPLTWKRDNYLLFSAKMSIRQAMSMIAASIFVIIHPIRSFLSLQRGPIDFEGAHLFFVKQSIFFITIHSIIHLIRWVFNINYFDIYYEYFYRITGMMLIGCFVYFLTPLIKYEHGESTNLRVKSFFRKHHRKLSYSIAILTFFHGSYVLTPLIVFVYWFLMESCREDVCIRITQAMDQYLELSFNTMKANDYTDSAYVIVEFDSIRTSLSIAMLKGTIYILTKKDSTLGQAIENRQQINAKVFGPFWSDRLPNQQDTNTIVMITSGSGKARAYNKLISSQKMICWVDITRESYDKKIDVRDFQMYYQELIVKGKVNYNGVEHKVLWIRTDLELLELILPILSFKRSTIVNCGMTSNKVLCVSGVAYQNMM